MIKAIKLVRWKWVTVVTAVLIVALAAGIATGTLQMEGIAAQERTSNTIEDSNVVDAATMISSANMAPVTSTSIFEEATIQRLTPATSAGSSVQPTSGEYLYLPFIDRYYSLPDDVELVETIQLGTCAPENAADVCPVMPIYLFERGTAKVMIDSVGRVSEDVPGDTPGDASAFPFFTTTSTTTEDG